MPVSHFSFRGNYLQALVLASFVLGVVAMWFVVKQTTVKVFANQYLVSVMDQANVALHIRAGKQMVLLTNIESALPSYLSVSCIGYTRGTKKRSNQCRICFDL